MKKQLLILFLLLNGVVFAQKGYVVNLAIDKIYFNGDSVKFPKGKKINVTTIGKTDTLEIGKCGGAMIGILVEVRKVKVGEQIRTQVGYSFYQKAGTTWELIHNFGYIDRYALRAYPANGKISVPKEEYHCEFGVPVQFSSSFRMDVYTKA